MNIVATLPIFCDIIGDSLENLSQMEQNKGRCVDFFNTD